MKYYSFKSCEKNNFVPKIQNYLGAFTEYDEKSVRLLRIHQVNLFITEKTQSESVRMQRICCIR
jgi:hypothetical protein